MADNIANILMQITGESSEGDATLATFFGKLKEFGGTKATAQADVNVGPGAKKIAELEAQLAAFARTHVKATAEVEVKQTGGLDPVLSALRGIGDRPVHVPVDVDDGAALAKLSALTAALKVVGGRKETVNLDVDTDKIGLGVQLAGKLASVLGGVREKASTASDEMSKVTVNLGLFGLKLGPMVAIVLALVVAMGVSLVAAAALLVTALVGAAAAVGALAVAFAGALGPAVALAIAAFTKIASILKILKARNTANADAARKSASGTDAASQADERRHNAALAVAQALQAVGSAERGRDQAVQAAKDAITQAAQEEKSASQDLGNATANVAKQMAAAYDAIRNSAEDARKALLDLAQAKLGIQEAGLATKQAELDLQEFRKTAGLAGKDFNDIFKKATDVAGGKLNVKALLPKLSAGTGKASPAAQALELQRLTLGVQQAKLNEKKATDTLSDAEQNLTDKRKEAARFQKDGIAAFEPYTQAVQAQRDATQRLATATSNYNKLEKEGIANNPGVLSATDALTNANVRLKEARHDAGLAAKEVAASDAAQKAQKDWDNLSSTQQKFGIALDKTIKAVKSFFGPAVDGVLAGLTTALSGSDKVLNPLKASFTQFGKIVGQVFAGFGKSLGDPAVQAAFVNLITAAGELAKTLGGQVFPAFFKLLLALATAAMPALITGTKKFGNFLQGLANNTGPSKLRDVLGVLFGLLKGTWGLVKAVGRVFIAFFKGTAGSSKGFLTTLTDMVNKFATFLASARGQNDLKKFFADVIPLAVQTIKFIGNVIVFILQLVQILAPAITGILSVINLIIGVVNILLGMFRPFLQVAAQIGALFIGGIPRGIAKVIESFKILEAFFGGFVGLLKSGFVRAITSIIGRLSFLGSVFPTIFDKIKGVVLGALSFISHQFQNLLHWITYPFRAGLKFLEGLAGAFVAAGKALVTNIVKGIKSAPKAIYKGLKSMLGPVGDLLPGSEPKDKTSPLAGLKHRGRAILKNLAEGVPQGARTLTMAVHQSLTPAVAGINANVSVPSAARNGSGPQYHGPYIAQQDVHAAELGGAGTDPDTQAALLALALRRRGKG